LQLNRHRNTEVALHRHSHAQLILYLSGEGVQTINGQSHQVRMGDLFVIPAGLPHGYSVTGRSRPVCLVLDYDSTGTIRTGRALHRRLGPATLNELSQLLSRLPQKGCPTLADYPTILAVVARLLCNPITALPGQSTPCLLDRVRPLLAAGHPLSAIARQTGYHRDHLTRKLKNETGFGLRATRDRMRLEAAQNALCGEASIAEASTKAGFDDPNYFARWFRRQTGLTPSAFINP
jgi:AraC-like DNA-binding protein